MQNSFDKLKHKPGYH